MVEGGDLCVPLSSREEGRKDGQPTDKRASDKFVGGPTESI